MQIAKLIGVKSQIKCPRCGGQLKQNRLRNARINRCRRGCGIWIDQKQLDQLAGKKSRRYEVTADLPAQFLDRRGAI